MRAERFGGTVHRQTPQLTKQVTGGTGTSLPPRLDLPFAARSDASGLLSDVGVAESNENKWPRV